MNLQTIPTQKEVDQAIFELLENRKRTFSDGIMSMLYPKDCRVSAEAGTGYMSFAMTEFMTNPLGIVHGGMIVTIFDTCGGMIARILTGVSTITTTDIQTSFLKPVQIGDTIEVVVKMTSRGKSLLHVTAEMRLPDGTIAATASMTYYVFKKPLDKRQQKDQ